LTLQKKAHSQNGFFPQKAVPKNMSVFIYKGGSAGRDICYFCLLTDLSEDKIVWKTLASRRATPLLFKRKDG